MVRTSPVTSAHSCVKECGILSAVIRSGGAWKHVPPSRASTSPKGSATGCTVLPSGVLDVCVGIDPPSGVMPRSRPAVSVPTSYCRPKKHAAALASALNAFRMGGCLPRWLKVSCNKAALASRAASRKRSNKAPSSVAMCAHHGRAFPAITVAHI